MSASPSLQPRRRPAQARSRERMERILEAARELVETRPAETVTAAAIARRAGLPIGSLYQYFPNRLAVLAELSRRSLEAIDREALAVLEDGRHLPWRQAVERVVDAHLEAMQRSSPATRVLRALAPSREFSEIGDESNARFADALCAHPALAACGGPRQRSRIARVAVEAAGAVEARVLGAGSTAEARALAREMKRLVAAYLALHIEGWAGDSGSAPQPR